MTDASFGRIKIPLAQCLVLIIAASLVVFQLNLEQDKRVRLVGVTVLDASAIQPGYNLFPTSLLIEKEKRDAFLFETSGELVHVWGKNKALGNRLEHVELGQDGSLMVLNQNHWVARVDRNSRVLWKVKGSFHHDFHLERDGSVVALAREPESVLWEGKQLTILGENLYFIDSGGRVKKKVTLSPLLLSLVPTSSLEKAYRYSAEAQRGIHHNTPADLFHTNHVQVVHNQTSGGIPDGSVLLSLARIDTVALVSPNFERILWSWGPGQIERQHAAHFIENGNILLFDNGYRRGWSQAKEISYPSGKVIWTYPANSSRAYFGRETGGVQRLANGNTLIAFGTAGVAIEVTPDGRKVWEFFNSREKLSDSKEPGESPEPIYRLERVPTNIFQ